VVCSNVPATLARLWSGYMRLQQCRSESCPRTPNQQWCGRIWMNYHGNSLATSWWFRTLPSQARPSRQLCPRKRSTRHAVFVMIWSLLSYCATTCSRGIPRSSSIVGLVDGGELLAMPLYWEFDANCNQAEMPVLFLYPTSTRIDSREMYELAGLARCFFRNNDLTALMRRSIVHGCLLRPAMCSKRSTSAKNFEVEKFHYLHLNLGHIVGKSW
jgi:hypothetical protein